MERFKKSLKIAITEKVEGLRLATNHSPCLLSGSSEQAVAGLQPYSAQELENLILALMPHVGAVDPSQPVQGELAIVNFGELKLIGHLGSNPRLFVFIPPQGNQLFRHVWNILTEAEHKAPAPVEPSQYEDDNSENESAQTGDFSMAAIYNSEVPDLPNLPQAHDEPSWSPDRDLADKTGLSSPPLPPATPIEFNETTNYDASFPRDINQDTQAEYPGDEEENDYDNNHLGLEKDYLTLANQPTVHTSPGGKEYAALRPDSYLHDSDSVEHEDSNDQESLPIFPTTFPNEPLDKLRAEPSGWQNDSSYPQAEGARETVYSNRQIYFGPKTPSESLDHRTKKSIDQILKVMVESGASDLHLTLGQSVSLRIDGEIQRLTGEEVDAEQMESLLLPIMPAKNQQEFLEFNDTDFGYEVSGLARFRVNIFRDINGVGAVLRQIPDKIPSADDLALPPAIRKLCELSKGLVLVTGPTGSGKSTTLAAMIDLINQKRHDHILTIEDPIEFVHQQKKCLVNQREVHNHTRSFSKALRAALREDPDIILIGEMRDLETIAIAIETAETGHLVFGTLHTNTAISTIDRLVDQFPADQQSQIRVMLAESLKGVVSQTLIKKKNGGRVAAHEILIVDRAVSSLIREGNTHMIQNHMQTQKAKGNVQLNETLLNLVTTSIITPQDAYHRAVDKDSFLKLLQQKGFGNDFSQVS